ncbi:MAG TPA: hypothetical protein VK623_10335 [Flavobacterium sp.]|nr:hypothetical protein [Flavobacterium sp.]
MKKTTLLLGAMAMIAFASCKKETTSTDVVAPATDTTVVIHDVAPAPPADTVTVKTEESDGTSVSVDANGVDVKSKDGTKKTTVNVSKDNAGVEVKK